MKAKNHGQSTHSPRQHRLCLGYAYTIKRRFDAAPAAASASPTISAPTMSDMRRLCCRPPATERRRAALRMPTRVKAARPASRAFTVDCVQMKFAVGEAQPLSLPLPRETADRFL
eukprot:scaffold4118_cov257-Pinguiococcus_pyrenoidosus.AAC.6